MNRSRLLTTSKRGHMLAAMLVAVLAASCAASGRQPVPLQPLVAPAATSPAGLTLSTDKGLRRTIEAALADAARRTGLPVASLSVISAEDLTWSDGSLGCPQPGAAYTMALVPGHRIRIRAQAQTLDYHANARGHLVLCPAGRSIAPTPVSSR